MTKTPIEALEDFDFTVNTHKDATMKKYNPNAPLIRAKTNYAKDKYNESERKIEERRLRSEKEAVITDEELVSFVGEVTNHDTEEIKNGDK